MHCTKAWNKHATRVDRRFLPQRDELLWTDGFECRNVWTVTWITVEEQV
jgi:hypothetical protein